MGARQLGKSRRERFTSPEGTAHFIYLLAPSYAFDRRGLYSVRLTLPPADAKPFAAHVKDAFANALSKARANAATAEAASELFSADAPLKEQPDGSLSVTFRSRPQWKGAISSGPRITNSSGKTLKGVHHIGDGTRMRIIYEMVPFNHVIGGVGLTLRIVEAQIVALVNAPLVERLGDPRDVGEDFASPVGRTTISADGSQGQYSVDIHADRSWRSG